MQSINSFTFCRYVFEIYQLEPNVSVNHGLIVPETNTLIMTCAAWGEWSPKKVPRCIRKQILHSKLSITLHHYVIIIEFIFCTHTQKLILIIAVNCTELPVTVPNNDRGMFDWTKEDYEVPTDDYLPRHYGTTVTYS